MKTAAVFLLLALSAAANAAADDICAGRWQSEDEFVHVRANDNEVLIVEKCQKDVLAKAPLVPRMTMQQPARPATVETPQEQPRANPVAGKPGPGESSVRIAEAAVATDFGKVHFGLNSAVISKTAKGELDAIAAAAKGASVVVTGYTCDIGSKKLNQRLATRRAEAVGGYLKNKGIDVATVSGKGKCCFETTEPSERSVNRRATVSEQNSK